MSTLLNIPDVDTRLKRSDHQALLDDVRRGHHMKLALAMERQIRIAKFFEQADEVHANGAMGERVMCVDSTIYWEMVRRYGPDCWRDKGFRKDMMRDEPALKVRTRSRNVTVRVQGRKGAGKHPTSNIEHRTSNATQARRSPGTRTPGGLYIP